MGMFDTLYDSKGYGWQTKALSNTLDEIWIGDYIDGPTGTYQMEVLGGPNSDWSFATVEYGCLVAVPTERNSALPLMSYNGEPQLWIGDN